MANPVFVLVSVFVEKIIQQTQIGTNCSRSLMNYVQIAFLEEAKNEFF